MAIKGRAPGWGIPMGGKYKIQVKNRLRDGGTGKKIVAVEVESPNESVGEDAAEASTMKNADKALQFLGVCSGHISHKDTWSIIIVRTVEGQ